MLKKVFETIDKKKLIAELKKNYSEDAIYKAIAKGYFSRQMSMDAEKITSISALFWLNPERYNTKGELKAK